MSFGCLWLLLWAAGEPACLEPITSRVVAPREPRGEGGGLLVGAGRRVTVFEASGAGVVRELSLLPPVGLPPAQAAVALRLVATWDESPQPAIDLAVGHFFGAVAGAPQPHGDQLGTIAARVWSTTLPMPFGRGARLELVNDSPRDLETGFRCLYEAWGDPRPGFGRLHVDHQRTLAHFPGSAILAKVTGAAGQVAGLRLDATSPMEQVGKLRLNAVLDGQPGELAGSLGELFGQTTPGGLPAAGLRLVERPEWRHRLAGYRSWLAAPLRFQQGFALSLEAADVPAAPEECDLTSTVYWYAAQPYADRPAVPPYDQRSRPYLGVRPSRLPTLRDFFDYLKADPNLELNFSEAKDTLRVGVYGAKYPPYPRWLGEPQPRPENPHPGRTGIMAVAPASADQVCRLAWKVALPADAISLVYAFSVDPYEAREQTDVVVAMRAFDGVREYRLHEAQLRGGEPRPEGWHAGSLDIQHLAGREIVFTVDLVPSGATASQANEELYLDRLAIIR